MDNNELRIGNLVTDSKTGKIVTVDGIQFTGRMVTHDESYDDFKRGIEPVGIPIAHEILEKAGFDRTEERLAGDYIYIIKRFEGQKRFALNISASGGYFLPMGTAIDVKYVHQLQNLYFALTGTELEIKL